MHAFQHARLTQEADRKPSSGDLLTAVGRDGRVEAEPTPWLSPMQARQVQALVIDLREYFGSPRMPPVTTDAARDRRVQGQRVALRLMELLKSGIRVRWHAIDRLGVRLRFLRARR